MFSIGIKGGRFFLNRTKSKGIYRYTLCKVTFPDNIHWKVAVNKKILLQLQDMSKKWARDYCQYLMTIRKQISMGDRGEGYGQ